MDGSLLLVVALLAAAVGAYVAVRISKRQAADAAKAPVVDPFATATTAPVELELRKLRVGDVVAHETRELVVRGTLRFDEDGSLWSEHLLDDAKGTRRWLSVEDDEGLECYLWQRLEGSGLVPDDDEIVHEGVTYRLDERGTAHYQAEGTTGTPPAGDAEYAEYTGGTQRMAFERFGGTDWEVSIGEPVSPTSLSVWNAAR